MALSASKFHLFPSQIVSSKSSHLQIAPRPILTKQCPKLAPFSSKVHKFTIIPKSSQEEENTPNPPAEAQEESSQNNEINEIGAEIKKAMQEREQKDPGFFGGVLEEIKEIEWPVFGKVLATTGVVVGVIAGSSVVVLTLNAILAELSDGVFAGKGVQDFFG